MGREVARFCRVDRSTAIESRAFASSPSLEKSLSLALSQRERFGSFDWYLSMNRRNRVEGLFGNLKDKARGDLNRGTIRVRGIFKT